MTRENERTALSDALASAALKALNQEWHDLAWSHFRGLRPPTLALIESRSVLGRWVPSTRTIEFSLALLMGHPWGVVVEVLKHEMAHQYVDEVLGVRDESSHGPVFRKVCEDRKIDAAARGIPVETNTAEVVSEGVLSKIAKLLALAESPNEHEAQAAMNHARRLMLKHNIDTVSRNASRGYTWRHLGTEKTRTDEATRLIGAILSDHFFVEVIWVSVWQVFEARNATVLEVCGTPENVSMAEYVYSFLDHTSEALWRLHKRARKIKGDRDRRAYRAGVMAGFREKLRDEAKSSREVGLVWVGDPALDAYFRGRWPRVRSVSSQSTGASEARAEGRAAGRKLVLHKGVGQGAVTQRGRQLGSGS